LLGQGVGTRVRLGRDPGGSGDELARWLAEGYAPAYRTALLVLHDRADAEEAVQEAFLRAWRFRAAVPDQDGVRPWLYRVVVNAALSKLRAEGRRSQEVGLDQEPPRAGRWPEQNDPEAQTVAGEQHRVVLDALAGLPEHLRVVVVLRYYAQLSEKEIATVIRRRPGTVKSRLHEARAQLSRDPRLLAVADDVLPTAGKGRARQADRAVAVGPGRRQHEQEA
jgi:RNA polymerase sigma-70 factor (ECF subfamily)